MFITFLFVTFFKLFCITLIHFTMQNDREHSLKHKLPHTKKQTNKLGGMWLITAALGADNCLINAFSFLKLKRITESIISQLDILIPNRSTI